MRIGELPVGARLIYGTYDDDDIRWVTREFMDLLIRSYTTQLEEGYSILAVSPDFATPKPIRDADVRASYRVEAIPTMYGKSTNRRERATA